MIGGEVMARQAKRKQDDDPVISMMDPKSLIPYANNANTHPPEQIRKIAASIRAFGFLQPIAYHKEHGIGAGHGRAEAAILLEMDAVPTVDCSHMSRDEFRLFVLADNRIAKDAVIDEEMLGAEMRALGQMDVDMLMTGFDQAEIDRMFEGISDDLEDDRYTSKVESPIYEPTGEEPPIRELVDTGKTEALIDEIDETELPDEIKAFLRHAAARHSVFNYAKIADFYAHADEATQRLMERSALVIIDYDQAIDEGFVKLVGAVAKEYEEISK